MRSIAEEPEPDTDGNGTSTDDALANLDEQEEHKQDEEDEEDIEVEVSDDEITIHSISSDGTSGNTTHLRRRSPRGSNASSIRRSSTGSGRQEDDDKTPLVTNKRSSRVSYPKTLIKMGRDVFSPHRLSFLSPSQLERRRTGIPSRKRADTSKNSNGRDGSAGDGDGSVASGMSRPPAYLGPTELHNICYAATDANVLHTAKFHSIPPQSDIGDNGTARATKVFSIIQREASIKDAEGRTAMHLLSRNRKLSRSAEDDTQQQHQKRHDASEGAGRMDAVEVASIIDFAVGFLLPANPMALIEEDNTGQIPFEYVLIEWIRRVHNAEFGLHRTDESNGSFSGNIENSLQQVQNAVNQSLSVSRAALANVGRSLHISGGGGGTSAVAQLQDLDDEQENGLSRSSSWTIESSGSTETISPMATDTNIAAASSISLTSDADVENSLPMQERSNSAPGGRTSRSLSAIKTNTTRRRQKSFQIKSLRRLPMEHTERLFPLHGRLSSHAKLVLLILSAVIDKLEEDAKAEIRSISIRSTEDASLYGASRSAMIKSHLIERIASVPNLMKTLLLIEDDVERNQVFELPIIRAAMLSRKAMGTWFTLMLRSEARAVSQRAVVYLGILSDASGEFKRQQQSATGVASSTNPDEIREAVLVLDDLIPSLVGLDEAAVEQAATTPIIRKVLDSMITRPFAISVVFFDGLFLLLLILSFRTAADGFVEGQSPDTVIKWIYVANANIFYFIIRELGKVVSLALITRKAFWLRFFWGFWNVVDIFSILFSLGSTIYLRVQLSEGVDTWERKAVHCAGVYQLLLDCFG